MEQLVFAQVSDPHFAASAFADPVQALGQNGHDLLLCQALPGALAHLRERTGLRGTDVIPVVMSGDLTRTGLNPEEFQVGKQYFADVWPNPENLPTRRYGLALGTRVLMIPGNHDHWDGDTKNQWGCNAAIRDLFERPTPFRLPWRKNRLIVEFYGLDSCSGFDAVGSATNRRARGRIGGSELDALTRWLAASAGKSATDLRDGVRRVRVIVCHHSFQGSWLVGWFRGSLELHARSRRTLEYLAGRYGVAAILTGHTHDFLADRYELQPFDRELREFRSATTLQGSAQYFKQGFYGHRIVLDDDQRVWWTAYPYEWQGSYFYPMAVEERVPGPRTWNPFYFEVR